ncbi:MAG TPA: response regulator [Longimicrobiales bacterium]|nr:response regulator [Longimicrobiales bacterium]
MSPSASPAVLLVEDNRDDAALAFLALSQEGLAGKVRWVGDGVEATNTVFDPASDDFRAGLRLILLDIHLPRMTGIEVLRVLKENPSSRRIPVVMLTSSDEASDVATCYDLGVNGYIVKGTNYETYTGAVVNAVRYWTRVNTSVTETGEVRRAPGA